MFRAVDPPEPPFTFTDAALAAAIFAFLLAGTCAMLNLPAQPSPLVHDVAANLRASGLGNPVNAVLLNFRAYDTLLETGVIVVALVGSWMLATDASWTLAPGNFVTRHPVEPPLVVLIKALVPLVAISAFYLLFVGSEEPGGAFPAGTMLSAIGILLILARIAPPPARAGRSIRWTVAAGFMVFALSGSATLLVGREFLDFPPSSAKAVILIIELSLAPSVAMALLLLASGLPVEPGRDTPA